MKISNFLIKADHFLDYTPIISTVSNIVVLSIKCILWIPLPIAKPMPGSYFYHIQNKKLIRSCILLIPGLGNLTIALTDHIEKKNHEKEQLEKKKKEEKTQIQQQELDYLNRNLKEPIEKVEPPKKSPIIENSSTLHDILAILKPNENEPFPFNKGIVEKLVSDFSKEYIQKNPETIPDQPLLSKVKTYLQNLELSHEGEIQTDLDIDSQEICKNLMEHYREDSKKQIDSLELTKAESNHFEQFRKSITQIRTQIEQEMSKGTEAHKILFSCQSKLRQSLASPIYQKYKYNESMPEIRFLHALALCSVIGIDSSSSSIVKAQSPTTTFFDHYRDEAKKNGGKIQQLKNSATSFYSYYINSYFSSNDPRADQKNILFPRYTKDNITYLATPTPTIGESSIAPEFLATLQAIENRYILSIGEDKNESFSSKNLLYSDTLFWNYINLQETPSHTAAIMKLQNQFPLIYSVITINTKERRKISANTPDELFAKIIEKPIEELNEETKKEATQELVEQILAKKIALFSSSQDLERDMKAIVELAYNKAISLDPEKSPWIGQIDLSEENKDRIVAWEKKMVFQTLISLLLVLYVQKKAQQRGSQGIQSVSCKETIDKGSIFLAELLFGSIPEKLITVNIPLKIISTVIQNRSILFSDLYPFLALSSHIPNLDVQAMLRGINQET